MKIKNVIFDLDGTLLDTTEGILESVKYVIRRLGCHELPFELLLKFIGPPIQQSFITYLGMNPEQAQKAADMFRDYYKTKSLLKAVPYAGIYELCNSLAHRQISMAVATYKREDYARILMQYYDFSDYCNPIHGGDNHNKLKKDAIVEMCMKEMGAAKDNTVLVGDTQNDAMAAERVGISFLAVTYGFGFKDLSTANEFANIGVADTPMEIADIIFNI